MWMASEIVVGYAICVLTLLTVVKSQEVQGLNDVQELKACGHEDLRIQCVGKEIIAIHEAVFTAGGPLFDPACLTRGPLRGTCIEDIKSSVNEKCSGVTLCVYNFERDHTNRRCAGPAGTVVVNFSCVPESKVYKSCNIQLTESEGYIMTPGYPHYYPRLENCTWLITGGSGQTVEVTVLDIEMRPPTQKQGPYKCQDVLTVYEGTTKLLVACERMELAQERAESQGNVLSVRFTSIDFASKRGIMMKYNLKGCPTLSPPKNGYLVNRNGSTALYMCCKDYVFMDTQDTSRTMHCTEGNRWNASMRHCIPVIRDESSSSSSLQIGLTHRGNWSNDAPVVQEQSGRESSNSTYIADIVIPSVLMAVLLLGNIIIIIVILRYRRRQKLREASSAETATLKPNMAPLVTET